MRQRLSSAVAVSFRTDYFSDHDGIVAAPVTPQRPLAVTGFSLGLDITPVERLLLRAEYRPLIASSAIFPRADGYGEQSHLFVVSIATWVDVVSPF